jgi:trigger factor
MLLSEPNRYIPADIKRSVRQRCFFGCVVCGLPVFQYDHIEPFATVQEHTAENIVLLCPTHHQDKTSKRLSADAVRACAAQPANKGKVTTTGHGFLMIANESRIVIGGNTFSFRFGDLDGAFVALAIRGETIISIEREDGRLLLNISLTDEEGQCLVRIVQGEIVVSTGVWDFNLEGSELKIWSRERELGVRLQLLDNGVEIDRGTIVRPQVAVKIQPDAVVVMPKGPRFQGTQAIQCLHGIVL